MTYLQQIWQNKWLTNNGPLHQQLEKQLAEYLGVKYYTLQAILSRQTNFACLNYICCVYRLHNGGVSNSNDYGGQIRYVNWYIQNRLMLNRLFPGECDFSEDELYDKERYLRLKLAISQFKYSEAIAVKDQIKTKMYRSKTYSKYMCNYVFFYMLYLHLKFIANEK